MTRYEEIKLENLAGVASLPWLDRHEVVSREPVSIPNADDDLHRESTIYQQALEAAREAKRQYDRSHQAFWRPADYYAEMIKSDRHMLRIKQSLLDEQQAIQDAEQRRKQRELRKFGKQVQVQKQLERQKQKTDMLDKLKEWKKRKPNGGGDGMVVGDDDDQEFEQFLSTQKQAGKHNKGGNAKKRQHRDEKFGFGGKKRFKKSNTAESTDTYEFSVKANRAKFGSRKSKLPTRRAMDKVASGNGKKAGGAAAKRPGKARRMKAKK